MSCTGCTSKFSFLNKDSSCQVCNFSFCSKCLKKVIYDGVHRKVCARCIAKENSKSDFENEPPAVLLKRLELLENPSKPPVTIFQSNPKLVTLKRGLSCEDQALVERLEKLKEGRNLPTIPSESEIKERLQALQGVQPPTSSENKTALVGVTPSKTSHEQVDELLMEYLEQIHLESSNKEVDDSPSHEEQMDSDGDDNEAAAKLVTRAIEEAALPDVEGDELGLSPPKFPTEWEPPENEFPWCEMCNGDATIRCLDCEGALYCQRCFKQGHDYFELKSHKTVPFKASV